MGVSPASLVRVPNLLASRSAISGLTRTGLEMLRVQEQLSSGKSILRPSDDAVRSSVLLTLDETLERTGQRMRNFQHAQSLLDTADSALGEASTLTRDAISIATSQIGVGSDAGTRASQAIVVSSLLDEMLATSNRKFTDVYVFGGARAGGAPIERFLGGFRYTGAGEGLRTDLGEGITFPVTMAADQAFGALSTRVRGDVDLNPSLTRATRLDDVRGTTGRGVTLGQIRVTIDPGVPVTVDVDLSGAGTVGDVLDRIESAIRLADPAALAGAYPTGAGTNGEALQFNVNAGYTITFADAGLGSTTGDLGLSGFSFTNATPSNPAGGVDPRLTDFSLMSDLNPGTPIAYGDVVFRNGANVGTVTVTPGMSIGEFKQRVSALGIGVRAEVGAGGRTLDVVNEVSGLKMAVEEGGSTTATTLGLRTMKASTSLSVFNDGRGVQIADGAIHPVTGLPDPSRNVDFRITLQDGNSFTVDLVPGDMGSVGTVLAKINAEAALAGYGAVFSAGLSTGGNGIVFTDSSGPVVGQTGVSSLNGHAAEDLGLLDGTFTAGAPAIFAGTDRARVRVDSVFSTLVELQGALGGNDQRGITLAGERLGSDVDVLIRARALVGSRSQRVDSARTRLEDSNLLTERIRSELSAVDYTEAATRFSLLELAQQAGLATSARSLSLTLLDFLR
ncbi:MAG: flagellin [Phycisphaerales bacterium]